jgi:spermidine/putrescine transport system permease protein
MEKLDKYLFTGYMTLVLAFLFMPIAVIMIFSFNVDRFASLPWRGFTLGWYQRMIFDTTILDALKNSIIVSTCVASSSCFLGFIGAYALYRRSFRYQNIFMGIMISPLAVPWIILGLAMLIFLTRINLEGSLFSVWISHTVFAAPFAMFIIRGRMAGLDVRYEEAGWDLGANRLRTIKEIILPLTAPGIVAAFLLTFTLSFDEFIIAWFVCGFQETLPVKIWGLIRSGLNPTINAIGSVIFVFSMTSAVIAQYLIQSRKGR